MPQYGFDYAAACYYAVTLDNTLRFRCHGLVAAVYYATRPYALSYATLLMPPPRRLYTPRPLLRYATLMPQYMPPLFHYTPRSPPLFYAAITLR